MSWGRVSRWSIVILAIPVTLLALFVMALRFGDRVSERNLNRIEKGMTPEQVVAIMGAPGEVLTDPETAGWKHKKRNILLLVNFQDGKVLDRNLFPFEEGKSGFLHPHKDLSAWKRFILWIGW